MGNILNTFKIYCHNPILVTSFTLEWIIFYIRLHIIFLHVILKEIEVTSLGQFSKNIIIGFLPYDLFVLSHQSNSC